MITKYQCDWVVFRMELFFTNLDKRVYYESLFESGKSSVSFDKIANNLSIVLLLSSRNLTTIFCAKLTLLPFKRAPL
jgi:hypothetical protein